MAPLKSMVFTTMLLALTPLARAACGLMPEARRSKPKRVRVITNHSTTPAAAAARRNPCRLEPDGTLTPTARSHEFNEGMRPEGGMASVLRSRSPGGFAALNQLAS